MVRIRIEVYGSGGHIGTCPLAVIALKTIQVRRGVRLSPLSLQNPFSHSMTSALISIMISDSSRLFP